MIQKVIEHINTKLAELVGFDPIRIKGLCENIEEDNGENGKRIYPGIYGGGDTLDFITTHDFKNGCIWHMKESDVIINEVDKMGRNVILEYTQPIKIYAINRRDLVSDSPYSADEMAANIVNKLNIRNLNTVKTVLELEKVQVQATGFNTKKDELDQIFQGVDIQNLKRYDVMYCSVSYNIIMRGRQNCFTFYKCTAPEPIVEL